MWNRALTEGDVHGAMFAMPARLPERFISPHGAAQRNLAAGRVLYARFNDPYTEAPNAQGGAAAGRSVNVSDAALRSSGVAAAAGGALSLSATDGPDPIALVGFPADAKYAFTGVPWAAPQVGAVTTEEAYGDASLPMDGGVNLTVHGVGFARSPFLKCAMVQHDPVAQFARDAEMGTPRTSRASSPDAAEDAAVAAVTAGSYSTHWSAPPPEAYVAGGVGGVADGLQVTTQVTTTAASVSFARWSGAPRVRADFESGMDVTWSSTDEYTRAGRIPPFAEDVHDPFKKEFNGGVVAGIRRTKDGGLSATPAVVMGYYETLSCVAPAAAFPSDRYGFAVSNDGGHLLSPTVTTTVEDFSLKISSGDTLAIPQSVRNAMGTTYTVSAWVLPTAAPASGSLVTVGWVRGASRVELV